MRAFLKWLRNMLFFRGPQILRHGHAKQVVFYYPDEEPTCIDEVQVTLYASGIVHLRILKTKEEITSHLQNCEIVWNVEKPQEQVVSLRLFKTHPNVPQR